LAGFLIGHFVKGMDAVVVAGERTWQYARRLGVPESKLLRGVYGFDSVPLEPLLEARSANGWPQRFLFAGRYVADKAIDVLLDGYALYRNRSANPWPLSCCGRGALQSRVTGAPSVQDLGFIQPADLPRVLLEHGVFVLVSRYEPWGVAIAESQYAGLPIICSEACGASVEIVRHCASGLLVPTEDPEALAQAMLWMEQHVADLPAMGATGKSLAKPFAAEFWAKRWAEKCFQITGVPSANRSVTSPS
jgi:glycosyltransferase involved in cell wall biosynthesis